MTSNASSILKNASFIKRTAALVYDTLVIIAILLLGTAIAMIVVTLIYGSEALSEQQILLENPLLFIWLLFCWFYYYCWCWQKVGQTLGMKTWKIKLVTDDNKKITCSNALIRFSSSLFGLANIGLFFPVKKGWQDLLSHSTIIDIKNIDLKKSK